MSEENKNQEQNQDNKNSGFESDIKKDVTNLESQLEKDSAKLGPEESLLLKDFKEGEYYLKSFVKKYTMWVIGSIAMLVGTVMLSIDPILTISDILYRTGMSLFIVSLAYLVRRKSVGQIKWVHPYDKIYAIAILIVIAIVFTFVKLPQINFIVNR